MFKQVFQKKLLTLFLVVIFIFLSTTNIASANFFTNQAASVWDAIINFFAPDPVVTPPPVILPPPKVTIPPTLILPPPPTPTPPPVNLSTLTTTKYVNTGLTTSQVQAMIDKALASYKPPASITKIVQGGNSSGLHVVGGGTTNTSDWKKNNSDLYFNRGNVAVGTSDLTGSASLQVKAKADTLGDDQVTAGDFSTQYGDEQLDNGGFDSSARSWTLGSGWSYSDGSVVFDPNDTSLGDEMIINGDFNGNADGWDELNNTTYGSNDVIFDNVSETEYILQNLSYVEGDSYQVEFDVSGSNNGSIQIYFGGDPLYNDVLSDGHFSFTGQAGADTYFVIYHDADVGGFTGHITNVSVKHIESGGSLSQSGTLNEDVPYKVSIEIGGTEGTVLVGIYDCDSFYEFDAGVGEVSFSSMSGCMDSKIAVIPSSDFNGNIDNVSVKPILWEPSGDAWTISHGVASHTAGEPAMIDSYSLDSTQTGYHLGDHLTLDGGNHDFEITVVAIDGDGAITDYSATTPSGTGYENTCYDAVGGHGAGAVFCVNSMTDTTNTGSLVQPGTLEDGARYAVSFHITGNAGTVRAHLDDGDGQTFNAGGGDVTFTGTYQQDSSDFLYFEPSYDFDGSISNVSVKPATVNTAQEWFSGSGSELLNITSSGNNQGQINFNIPNSSNYVALRAPTESNGNVVWTLPGEDGSNGNCLKTNGSGQLYFGDCGGGGNPFDQDLNSNNNVTFNTITVGNCIGCGGGGVTTDGSDNTFAGINSGSSNPGNTNSGYGSHTLSNNTSGFSNTANGAYALNANTGGYYNTADGAYALYHNTNGYFNTAIGFDSLPVNTSGNNNTALGPHSLYSNTTGNNNTAIGFESIYSNSTGSDNTAVGLGALYGNVSGFGNVGFGSNSGASITSGYYNVAGGSGSMSSLTTGFRNTALGEGSGNSLTTGSLNVLIGSLSDVSLDGQNEIAIGYGATSTAANHAVIGNSSLTDVYFGSESANANLHAAEGLFSGNVGIGTSSPGSKLEVVGDIISKGTSWTTRVSGNSDDFLNITYGNGLFVTSSFGKIQSSPDGINWTFRHDGGDAVYKGITYGNGLFVAVANNCSTIETSPDAINWTTRTSADVGCNALQGVVYGNGLFVIVGGGGSIETSPDGIHWIAQTSGTSNDFNSVTYGNGLFVAVGDNTVFKSSDGSTWSDDSQSGSFNSVTYGNGLFVAVGNSGAILTSRLGSSWSAQTSGISNVLRGVSYGNGLFVAVGDNGKILTSSDGATWKIRTSGVNDTLRGITYGNGIFVADGENDRILTSGKEEINALTANNIYQGGANIFGNIGINCADPDHILELGGTGTGCNTGTGSYINAGDLAFTANSSREWKTNIQDYTVDDILNKIDATPVRTYDWKPQFCSGDNCNDKLGFIAQEFYTVLQRGDGLHVNGQDISMAEWLGIQALYHKFVNLKTDLIAWFGDATNGIADFFANRVHTKEICVAKTDGTEFCANGDELEAAIGTGAPSGGSTPPPAPDPVPPTCIPPQTLVNNVCTDPAPDPVSGCTDATATNYNGNATVDDGSCIMPPPPPAEQTPPPDPVPPVDPAPQT